MSADEILVVLGGLAAIAWVNHHFFFAERTGAAAAVAGGAQEVVIRVAGGYDPANVRVKTGTPVRLIFDRRESAGCSETVVLPDFGIRRFLPAHRRTAVELPSTAAGSYDFTCGMGMLRGRIIVEE